MHMCLNGHGLRSPSPRSFHLLRLMPFSFDTSVVGDVRITCCSLNVVWNNSSHEAIGEHWRALKITSTTFATSRRYSSCSDAARRSTPARWGGADTHDDSDFEIHQHGRCRLPLRVVCPGLRPECCSTARDAANRMWCSRHTRRQSGHGSRVEPRALVRDEPDTDPICSRPAGASGSAER